MTQHTLLIAIHIPIQIFAPISNLLKKIASENLESVENLSVKLSLEISKTECEIILIPFAVVIC